MIAIAEKSVSAFVEEPINQTADRRSRRYAVSIDFFDLCVHNFLHFARGNTNGVPK